MEFEWNENKNKINLSKHGFELRFGRFVFNDANRLYFEDNRQDYGEDRLITIGLVIDKLMFVVFTLREDVIRLISVRRANKKERRLYYGNR